jgi:hypothetical protein
MSVTRIQTFTQLARDICTLETPVVVGVDGRSASGKTTLAARLAHALDAPVVHTDDVARHPDFFDWWPLLTQHVLEPFRAGRAIDWTPDVWKVWGREGSILVPPVPVLILEGVGATRTELVGHVGFPIWVETHPDLAEVRGLERDGPDERDFWFEWQSHERPFLERDQPWTRAKMIIDGAPTLEHDPETQFVTIKSALV